MPVIPIIASFIFPKHQELRIKEPGDVTQGIFSGSTNLRHFRSPPALSLNATRRNTLVAFCGRGGTLRSCRADELQGHPFQLDTDDLAGE